MKKGFAKRIIEKKNWKYYHFFLSVRCEQNEINRKNKPKKLEKEKEKNGYIFYFKNVEKRKEKKQIFINV